MCGGDVTGVSHQFEYPPNVSPAWDEERQFKELTADSVTTIGAAEITEDQRKFRCVKKLLHDNQVDSIENLPPEAFEKLLKQLDYNKRRKLDISNAKLNVKDREPTEAQEPHAASSGNREDIEARRPQDNQLPAMIGVIRGKRNR